MRLFKIKNSRGQEYDLNDLENFFHDPSGLGFKRDTSYRDWETGTFHRMINSVSRRSQVLSDSKEVRVKPTTSIMNLIVPSSIVTGKQIGRAHV